VTDNTEEPTKFQETFERQFRGHRIIAMPEKGGQRPWDPKNAGLPWIAPSLPWRAKQRDCKFYFLPGRMKPGSKTNQKPDMMDSSYVWADLDPREGQPLEAERVTMLGLLSYELPDNVPTPTFIVDSGRGYWGFWKLKTPHVFDGPGGDSTRVFEAVLRGLANAFGDYGDTAVTNINRIARLPGSINPKTGQRAEVVEYNPQSYSLEDFPSIIVERKPRRVDSDVEAISTDLLKRMLAATPYTGGPAGLDNRSSSYKGWLEFAMAVHETCGGNADGLAAFTEWCLADPDRNDDPEKIQAHWDSFDREAAGGVTRASWTKLLQFFPGNDEIVSDATPGTDAEDDFADQIDEPEQPTTPAIDLEKIKRKIKKLMKNTTERGRTPEEAATFLAKARQLMAENNLTDADLEKKKKEKPPTTAKFEDFIAHLPDNKYIFIPTGDTWSASTITSILGKDAAINLDRTRHCAVMGWAPGEPVWIKDKLLLTKGGWVSKPGSNMFNTYMAPPTMKPGNKGDIAPWLDHFKTLYPTDFEHMIKVFAHKVRFPGIKINHCLIMGSDEQGIGKDSLLEPIVRILGEWNVKDVTATQSMDPKFNPHLESLVCRISEADELGDDDKFSFYRRRKTWAVAPPNTISVADKHVKAHPVVNVTLPVISLNEKSALYIDRYDRRDYVAWSDCKQADFTPEFFVGLHAWYDQGGTENVNAYLRSLDLSGFNPKAPPPKTAAWTEIVNSDQTTQTTELDDLIDYVHQPWEDDRPVVFTLSELIRSAAHRDAQGRFDDALEMLQDKRQAKALSHKLSRAGYQPVMNDAETEGRWRVAGKRVVIYGRTDLPMRDRLEAAAKLVNEMLVSDAAQQARYRAARKAARPSPA
jgi:hypothetical protein